ncbi:unnamed protein product [Prunus brigantina]
MSWSSYMVPSFCVQQCSGYIVRDLDGTGNKRENPGTNPMRHY